ncbi:low molecular weight protein-tyrosine-phosphatase [Sphingomonas sp. RT2P30]|uniref:low molecular weight protein-tyrosine-phosphatase n=1 Tax=Parasphingomonas halimpatiens TaxID=3096162 RepID=UPI002FCB8E90
MTAPTPPAILFVCLGNICRSPLAEAALRAEADRAGLAITVDSAGTGDWHSGKAPDRRAQAVALRHGIDIAGYRARQVTVADFARFTHIFALDPNNLATLRRLAPGDARAELALLLDLLPGRAGEGVADPYFGTAAGFDKAWHDVHAAACALITRLQG